MRRLLVLAAVMAFFGCGPCAAQESGFGAAPAPGSGNFSPLGAIVTTLPVSGTGIDLGLSELFVVGLSPLTTGSVGGGTGCPDEMTEGSTPASTISGYDSGETGPVGVSTMSPGCGATTIGGVNLAAGLSSVPGSIAVNNYAMTYLGAPLVPLGATTLSTAGIGPPLVAPAVNCTSIAGLSIDGTSNSAIPGMPSVSTSMPSISTSMSNLSTLISTPSTSMSSLSNLMSNPSASISSLSTSMSNLYTSASSLSTTMSFSCGTTF
jgi:hypothetical protein